MAISFNADEIFEMAEQIERNGANFYRKAAAGASTKELRKLFQEFVEMEVAHIKIFAAMRAELSTDQESPTVFDPNDEVGLYLCAMADGRVFDIKSDSCEKLTGQETTETIFNIAIGLEKDSIVFYLGLEASVSDKAGKDKVRKIIKEEMGHITLLDSKLKALQQ